MPRKHQSDLSETAYLLDRIKVLLEEITEYKTIEPSKDQELLRRILMEWSKTAEPSSAALIKGVANSLKENS